MAETQTLARPYAEAVFELAESQGRLDEWSQALNALSTIVSNPDVAMLLNNPEVADSRLAEVVIEIGSEDLDDSSENLVRLLVANGRLGLAPAIATLYEQRKAQAEHRVDVSVTSAVEFSEEQRSALAKSLEKRLDRSVRLTFEQDEDVIGGAVIRAGDLVIDGSLRAQLERMRQSLAQ
ncbi:F0F1 ATP synthase subunit delta [Salinisphaera shabanensis T35B1]|jgi:F-type H+-transporting ATPase subunit delta|uniref:ATP synthase subunit delta n=1 Tax=Salinisphaera shabanensis E1L3A TaxID=1033802 RepID=U2ELD6_9GAMM|nr:F0F1 ATP synthase subunit delta [Salinisphaera shabanensis]ERJ18745.1 ATP synthase subunit delta protein [Salinisphaera shabanensis E1L3A]|tara:strand:+ start:270 stop:806 length:537 start_codon:yes stop_codon:yes gene_type:complete